MSTVRVVITGRVQGVNYRAAARDMAIHLGLSGWVRNTPDGSVELAATGPEPALKKLISWCHKGPPLASVADVTTERLPETLFTGLRSGVDDALQDPIRCPAANFRARYFKTSINMLICPPSPIWCNL